MLRPFLNFAPTSNSPETNCEEAEASISISPPATSPLPRIEKGSASPLTLTPSARSESIVVFMGRFLAARSPSKSICPVASEARAGTKRITVPARPQSMVAGPDSFPGVITRACLDWSMPTPNFLRASIINDESRDSRGSKSLVGALASAERISSRLLRDLEPGRLIVAARGIWVLGASQGWE